MRRSLLSFSWISAVLLLICVAGCCTPGTGSFVPPTLVSATPIANTSGACPTSTVTAVFSEAMNAASITPTTFTLTGPAAAAVAGQVTYSAASRTATFTPGSKLAAGTLYTATVTTGATDAYGNTMANNYVWMFSTAANGCNPPPVLTSLTPAGGAAGVCPNAAVVATFNEAMNPATINQNTFSLAPGVIGTVSHDPSNTIFTLTPSTSLAASKTYTATITTGAQDTYGNPLGAQITSSFTTAANSCQPPPTVQPASPIAGATGVCPNRVITALFSEPMNPLTINASNFGVTLANGTPVAGVVSYDPLANLAIFTPSTALALNSSYTAKVNTGVQDMFGNSLALPLTWTFSTGGNSCLPAAPPVSVTPASGATGVCQSTAVAATFAQLMNPATINAASFTLTSAAGVSVASTISVDATGKTFTLTPKAPLALSTTYTATITTSAQDTFGNPLAANYAWSFTTAAVACGIPPTVPVVTATSPLLNALGVCSSTVVTATFSEAMSPASVNAATFVLSPAVAGTVTLDGTGTIAAFTPSTGLALNTTYSATITTGVMDLLGNALAANYVWSFKTAALACQNPIALGVAGNFEVLAGSTVTNTGGTVITGGNLGLSPGTSVTGFPPGTLTVPASMHITDQMAAQAELDLTVAYNNAAGLAGGAALPADLTGRTLTPGLYTNASTVTLSSGNVTLDAQGNANAVFIFQVGSTLTTMSNTQVVLAGGAQAKNIFWQVGSSATLGTNSVFKGTIMALQSITLQTGANMQGRALARNAAVTLDTAIVTAP